MAKAAAPKREGITNAIVLVFSHSKLKDLVGTDALRSVLSGQYLDLVHDNTLHLQLIWDLLADQPGFSDAEAEPAFCTLKMWEKDLQLTVALPTSLADHNATEIMAGSSHCPVPQRLKQRALYPEEAQAKARASLENFDTPKPPSEQASSTRKPGLEILLAVVGVAGLAYGGYTLASSMAGPGIESVGLSEISTMLPVGKANRLGKDLHLTLSDDQWFALSLDERTQMLESTLRSVRVLDIDVLLIQDSAKVERASAQWVGEPPAIQSRFY